MKKLLFLLLLLIPQEAQAARLWSSGFELQSVTAAVEWQVISGSPVIDTSTKHSGAASLRIASMSSGTDEGVLHRAKATFDEDFIRGYLYITTLPSAENSIMQGVDGITFTSTVSWSIRLQSDGSLILYNGATPIGSASSALSTGTWYRIEVQYSQEGAGGDQILGARINGAAEFATSSALSVGDYQSIVFGGNLAAEAQTQGDWYWDDIAFNDDNGASQASWPGDGSIVHMQPDATGDNNDGTVGGSAPAATTYESLDEVTPDDGVTMVSFTSTANILDLNFESASSAGIGASDTITLVQGGLRWSATTAASCASRLRIESQAAGTIVLGTASTTAVTAWHINDDTTPRNYKLTSYVDPQAGGVWTPTLLDSMQLGIGSTDVTPNPIFSTIWALVEYVPSPYTPVVITGGATLTGGATIK